jgi:hypothetical protein
VPNEAYKLEKVGGYNGSPPIKVAYIDPPFVANMIVHDAEMVRRMVPEAYESALATSMTAVLVADGTCLGNFRGQTSSKEIAAFSLRFHNMKVDTQSAHDLNILMLLFSQHTVRSSVMVAAEGCALQAWHASTAFYRKHVQLAWLWQAPGESRDYTFMLPMNACALHASCGAFLAPVSARLALDVCSTYMLHMLHMLHIHAPSVLCHCAWSPCTCVQAVMTTFL